MELFLNIVNSWELFPFFPKTSILDVLQGVEDVSVTLRNILHDFISVIT